MTESYTYHEIQSGTCFLQCKLIALKRQDGRGGGGRNTQSHCEQSDISPKTDPKAGATGRPVRATSTGQMWDERHSKSLSSHLRKRWKNTLASRKALEKHTSQLTLLNKHFFWSKPGKLNRLFVLEARLFLLPYKRGEGGTSGNSWNTVPWVLDDASFRTLTK